MISIAVRDAWNIYMDSVCSKVDCQYEDDVFSLQSQWIQYRKVVSLGY